MTQIHSIAISLRIVGSVVILFPIAKSESLPMHISFYFCTSLSPLKQSRIAFNLFALFPKRQNENIVT